MRSRSCDWYLSENGEMKGGTQGINGLYYKKTKSCKSVRCECA